MYVRAPTQGLLPSGRLGELASVCPKPDGLPLASKAIDIAARKAKKPINRDRLWKAETDFFFIARISDQRVNLVLFKILRTKFIRSVTCSHGAMSPSYGPR